MSETISPAAAAIYASFNIATSNNSGYLEDMNEDLTQFKSDLATLQGLPSGITPQQLEAEYPDLFTALVSDAAAVDQDIQNMQNSSDPLDQGVVHNTDGDFNKIARLFQNSTIGGKSLETILGEDPKEQKADMAEYFSVLLNTSGQGDLDNLINAAQKFVNAH